MTREAAWRSGAAPALSVVMPVRDEAEHLPATIDALVEALSRSTFAAELVLVDDGSRDGSAETVRAAAADRLPLAVVRRQNAGRFAARSAGVEAAGGEWLLFLDARVRLRADSLAFVAERLALGEIVWNGHVHVETAGNPYGAFWNAVVEVGWRDYFADPRTTSFDSESFDRFPKGTGCFLARRDLIAQAFGAFRSRYADVRHASDDTLLVRWIAERERIHVSPSFACDYRPRASLPSFVRHATQRGTMFLDGHGRRESRFFPLAVSFFPVSAAIAALTVRRPLLAPVVTTASASLAAGALAAAAGRPAFETASVAALAPVYAVAHGIGMWRGLAIALRDAVLRSPPR